MKSEFIVSLVKKIMVFNYFISPALFVRLPILSLLTFDFFVFCFCSDHLKNLGELCIRRVCFAFFVPTFDTKITEYLCSGWVFVFRPISTF